MIKFIPLVATLVALAACAAVPGVDECRIGATVITPQGSVIIHLDSKAIEDPQVAKFVTYHELYHGLTGSRDEFAADRYAEELSYLGNSPCPAARHLQTCGNKMDSQQLKDRAKVLGEGNRCLGFV